MNKIEEIVQQAIDIHLHIGPEIIPRKYTVAQLIAAESGKISGAVLKNHFYPTSPLITGNNELELFGGIVLNNAVGGMNPDAIRAAAMISDKLIVVWFPTISSEQFLNNSEYEIAPEWLSGKNIKLRRAEDVKPVKVTKNGKLLPETKRVLRAIAEIDAILATGHISWQESMLVIDYALSVGVKRIVVTHPIYQRIAMPIKQQKELTQKGCFIEQCYSMHSIDKIPIKQIAGQIRAVGADSVILSSDMGQIASPPPSEALFNLAKLLLEQGITIDEIETMIVKNPTKLLKNDKMLSNKE